MNPKLLAMIIGIGASFLPDRIVKMNFLTSLIVSTIVYYVVYKIVLNLLNPWI